MNIQGHNSRGAEWTVFADVSCWSRRGLFDKFWEKLQNHQKPVVNQPFTESNSAIFHGEMNPKDTPTHHNLVGGLEHGFYFSLQLGMEKSSQLTKSMIFQRGRAKNHQPDRCLVFLSFIHWWCVVCWTSVGTSKTTTWERWSGPAAPGHSLRSLPLGLWSKPGSDSAIFLGKLRIVWDHRMGGA